MGPVNLISEILQHKREFDGNRLLNRDLIGIPIFIDPVTLC